MENTPSVEELTAKIKELEDKHTTAILERDKAKGKLRDLEQASKHTEETQKALEAALAEASDYKSKFENLQSEYTGFKTKLTEEKISSTLQTALEAAGAKSITSAMKLLDRSAVKVNETGEIDTDSVKALINSLKESDPIFFGEAQDPKKGSGNTSIGTQSSITVPSVKRADEDPGKSSFDVRLEEAMKSGNLSKLQSLFKDVINPQV